MRIFLLILLLLPVSQAVGGTWLDNFKKDPARFAKSVNLKPLENSKTNEIRIWVKFLSSVRGTVVADNGIARYSNKKSGRLELVKSDPSAPKIDLMKFLPSLSELSKYTYICDTGIHGGAFYFIEGNYNGKYFFTIASWPKSCSSPEFDALNEFLHAAGEL